ncbi:hypothetical protein SALBM311S_10435 [Streptomyces alboniger]
MALRRDCGTGSPHCSPPSVARRSAIAELFATYKALLTHVPVSRSASTSAELHREQRTAISPKYDGVGTGAFTSADPATTAAAVFHATDRFHNPDHARKWELARDSGRFEDVVELVVRGLRAA